MLSDDPEQSLSSVVSRRASRADAVLLSIPLVALAAVALVAVPSISLSESVILGTAAALAVTAYALVAGAPEN